MKYVLAGSLQDYDGFIQKLWEKDKDISNYQYIPDAVRLHGIDRGHSLVILKNGRNRDDSEEIIQIAESKGMYGRRRDRVMLRDGYGFSSGGIAPSMRDGGFISYVGTPPSYEVDYDVLFRGRNNGISPSSTVYDEMDEDGYVPSGVIPPSVMTFNNGSRIVTRAGVIEGVRMARRLRSWDIETGPEMENE